MGDKKTQKKSEFKNQKKNVLKNTKNSKRAKAEKGDKKGKENFKPEDLSEGEEEISDKTQNIFQDNKVKVKKIKKGKVI